MATKFVVLKTLDQRRFKVGMEVGKIFQYFAMVHEENQPVIQLNFLTGDVLEKVLEWAEHQLVKHQAGDGNFNINRGSGMSDWEENYLRKILPVMRDVAKASFALDMIGLQNLFFRLVFNWLRGKMHVQVPDAVMFHLGRFLKSKEPAPRR